MIKVMETEDEIRKKKLETMINTMVDREGLDNILNIFIINSL